MGKHFNDLDVRLTSPRIDTLRPENEYFLRGQLSEPALDSVWEGWKTVGKIMMLIGVIGVVAVAALLGYFIVWNSPLAVTVEGTIDNYQFGNVYYHYVVDDVRYDKVEPSNRSVSDWDEGNVPHPVVYLSFLPAESRLTFNVESLDWFLSGFLLAIPIGLVWLGRYTIRFTEHMILLRDEATHVLQGEIYESFSGQKGTVNYLYKAVSPTTGKHIGGMLTIGRLNARFGRIAKGSPVAVLYRDDKRHTVL